MDSENVYLGSYIEIPKQTKNIAVCSYMCQECLGKTWRKTDKFCSICGGKVKEEIREELREWGAYGFLWSCMEPQLSENLAAFDPEDYCKYTHHVYYPNIASPNIGRIRMQVDGDDGGVWDMGNINGELAKKMLQEDFAKEIAILKKSVKEGDTVETKFGLLRYTYYPLSHCLN